MHCSFSGRRFRVAMMLLSRSTPWATKAAASSSRSRPSIARCTRTARTCRWSFRCVPCDLQTAVTDQSDHWLSGVAEWRHPCRYGVHGLRGGRLPLSWAPSSYQKVSAYSKTATYLDEELSCAIHADTTSRKWTSRLEKSKHRWFSLAASSAFSLGGLLRFCTKLISWFGGSAQSYSVVCAMQEVVSELGAPVSVFRKSEDPNDGYGFAY
jgi:hypothetical protein